LVSGKKAIRSMFENLEPARALIRPNIEWVFFRAKQRWIFTGKKRELLTDVPHPLPEGIPVTGYGFLTCRLPSVTENIHGEDPPDTPVRPPPTDTYGCLPATGRNLCSCALVSEGKIFFLKILHCRNHVEISHALGGFAPAAGASPLG
jgi:hypothetical protein